jgi:sugar fermentation stimulation protein A
MQLPELTDGRLIRRYKRFFADIELPDGTRVTAHCPNTGSMRSCLASGAPVQLSYHDNPRRKLKWTLQRIDMGEGWIGVNTNIVNNVIAEAIEESRIPQLRNWKRLKREVRVDLPGQDPSRLDIVLDDESPNSVYIEIKNVTFINNGYLQFPDAVSERATRHLKLLTKLADSGSRAVILFAINRPEGDCFRPARDIDPVYAQTLETAVEHGVSVIPLRLIHRQREIVTGGLLEYTL